MAFEVTFVANKNDPLLLRLEIYFEDSATEAHSDLGNGDFSSGWDWIPLFLMLYRAKLQ